MKHKYAVIHVLFGATIGSMISMMIGHILGFLNATAVFAVLTLLFIVAAFMITLGTKEEKEARS